MLLVVAQYYLKPTFSKEIVASIEDGSCKCRALDGTAYTPGKAAVAARARRCRLLRVCSGLIVHKNAVFLRVLTWQANSHLAVRTFVPGVVGVNNIRANDYVNVVLQVRVFWDNMLVGKSRCGGNVARGKSLLSTAKLFKYRPTLPHCPTKIFPQGVLGILMCILSTNVCLCTPRTSSILQLHDSQFTPQTIVACADFVPRNAVSRLFLGRKQLERHHRPTGDVIRRADA